MSKTTSHNGVARPPLYRQKLNNNLANHSTSREAPNDNFPESAEQSSVSEISKLREGEVLQSREVLLKLLQPPAPRMPGNGCSLPHHEKGKTHFTSDVCGSHCLQCLGYRPTPNPAVFGRVTTGDPGSRTPDGNWEHRSVSKKDPDEKRWGRGLQIVDVPGTEEDLPRTGKSTVFFPPKFRCRSGESGDQQFCLDQCNMRTARCQHVFAEAQQYSVGNNCFRKDSFPNDHDLPPSYNRTQMDGTGVVNLSKESPRKLPGNLTHVFSTGGCYHKYHPRIIRVSTSDKNLMRHHPDMATETNGQADHVQPIRIVNDVVRRLDEESHTASSSSSKHKAREPSCPLLVQRHGRDKSFPAEKSLQSQSQDESKTRQGDVAEDNSTLPDCPSESSQIIERPLEECTPVIVHCYSLSEHGLRNDHEIDVGCDTSINHVTSNGNSWFPGRHSGCEDPFDSSFRHRKGITHACSHNYGTHPKYSMKDPDDKIVVKHEENCRTSVMPPGHIREKFMPSTNDRGITFPTRSCSNGCESNCTQNRQRPQDSKKCPDLKRTPERLSQTAAEQNHVAFRQMTSRGWPSKHTWHGGGPIVKIHDFYEERRILVGKLYRDIPRSVEDDECKPSWNIPCVGRSELHREDPGPEPGVLHGQFAGTQMYQTPSGTSGPFRIHVYQQELAVGSKKRKSRQPRPQRAKSNDLAHFHTRNDDIQQFHFVSDHSDKRFEHRQSRHQTNPSTGTCQDEGEDEEIPDRNTEFRSSEDDQASVSDHFNNTNRCENRNVENLASSRSRILRRDIPFATFPILCNSSEGPGFTEQYDLLFPKAQHHKVPSYGAISRRHQHENHLMPECQTNSRSKCKISSEITENSFGNEAKRDPEITQRSAVQQHWHSPARRPGPNKEFETWEERGPHSDNVHQKFPLGARMVYSDPSQHDMPNERVKAFPSEANSELRRDCAAECHFDNSGYPQVHEKGKHSNRYASQPSSPLTGDHGSVSSAIVGDHGELMMTDKSSRLLQTEFDDASMDDNIPNISPTEEQSLSHRENQSFFLHTQGVCANYVDPRMKERRFVCRYCCKKFAHFSTLQNHLRTHTGDKPFQCKFCSRRFAQSGVLKAHLRTHTGDKPFVCVYCRKTFAQSTTLTNHLRTHTGQKPYVCNFCGKSFSQPSTLRKHELSHTKERPYPCKFCGKAFAQQSTLTNHLRSHTGQRPYRCQFCEKSFAQLSTLDRHLRLHSSVSLKPHQCQYCAKSFSYFSNLASHMQIHQEKQRPAAE